MRILTFNSHEGYVSDLARVGEPMDVVIDLGGHHVVGWDERMRPIPRNIRLVRLADVGRDRYDCIIAHNITDLLAVKRMPGARVLVLHSSLLGRLEQEGSRQSPEQIADAVRTYMKLVGVRIVVVSEMKRRTWGLDAEVITAAADIDEYGPWDGTVASALRVANHVTQKTRYLRWEMHERIFSDLPCKLVGVNPDRQGVEPARGWDDLKQLYRSHRLFVHTAEPELEDGYNMAMLEAMATGMPVLASAHPTSPIEDGVNGFISDDVEELRDAARELLARRDLARQLGARARDTVRDRFPMARFVQRWRDLLERSVAGR